MKKAVLFFFLFLTSFQICYSQRLSVGLSEHAKRMDHFGQLTIEVDSVTGLAISSVPIDRPFFLRIIRPPSYQPPLPPGSPAGATPPPIAHATQLVIKLYHELSSVPKFISVTKVKQASGGSRAFMVPIPPLRANSTYRVVIFWSQVGAPNAAFWRRYSFTTNVDSLTDRVKQRVVPQFGVSSAFFRRSGETYSKPAVLLSVYYHPVAINSDIPMHAYHPLAPQRFSLMGGVTLSSLAATRLRDDLFAANNLVFGVGYQPFDAVRIAGGRLFFFELNPNPLLASQRSFANTFFCSLTVDIKIKDLLAGVFTVLGFK